MNPVVHGRLLVYIILNFISRSVCLRVNISFSTVVAFMPMHSAGDSRIFQFAGKPAFSNSPHLSRTSAHHINAAAV